MSPKDQRVFSFMTKLVSHVIYVYTETVKLLS